VVDLPADADEVAKRFAKLYDAHWVDIKTVCRFVRKPDLCAHMFVFLQRAIIFDVSYYNPNVDLFLTVRVLYEFQSCGFITVTTNNRVMRADKYHMATFANFVEIGAQGVVVFLVGFYILQELRQIVSDGPVAYFSSFWNFVDVTNLLLFAAVAFLRITSTFQLQAELLAASASKLKSSLLQNISFTVDLEKNLIAINCVLMWVKILKYVSAHRKFNKISRTIKYSRKDIVIWFLIFAVSVYGFSLGGMLLLGMEDSNYKDLSKSFQTLVNAAFGDLRFAELYRSNKVMGPLYMLLWIIYVRALSWLPSVSHLCCGSSTHIFPACRFAFTEHGHQHNI
jgi:hypothetical protein